MAERLSDEQRREAAAGDVDVLAALMLLGSTAFALVNYWIGTMGWIAVLLSITSTSAWSLGLWQRSSITTAFVAVGFGIGGLAAPVFGIVGVVLAILGFTWGWAILGGSVLYLAFSVLGLEIIERAHDTGAIERFAPDRRD